MKNLYGMTAFLRKLKDQPVGFSTVYLVQDGKTYGETQRNLTATACRVGIAIAMTQIILAEVGQVVTTAIRVTKK